MSGQITSMWTAIKVVFNKELKDGLRDRRSIFIAMLYPIIGPLMIAFVFFMISDKKKEVERIDLQVVGAENAPEIISWLEQNGVETKQAPADPKKAVRDGDARLVLRLPENYAEKVAGGKTVVIELLVDETSDKGVAEIKKITRLIEVYGKQLALLRLMARGVSPELVAPIDVREVNVASRRGAAAALMLIIPMFVVLAAFLCGMPIAIDTTAGERERGSLESLLINPVHRTAIVLGKWLAVVVFAGAGTSLTLTGMLLVLNNLPLEEIGLSVHLGSQIVAGLFSAILPLALLAPGALMLVSAYARSDKEAQAYCSVLMILSMIPFYAQAISGSKAVLWKYSVPALGQHCLMTDVLNGQTPSLAVFALAGVVSLIGGIACVWLTARLFKKESIIFGR